MQGKARSTPIKQSSKHDLVLAKEVVSLLWTALRRRNSLKGKLLMMLLGRPEQRLDDIRAKLRVSFTNVVYRPVGMRKHASSLYLQIRYLEYRSRMRNGSLYEILKRTHFQKRKRPSVQTSLCTMK